MSLRKKTEWWAPSYGFFGKFYMHGDDSLLGYQTNKKQSLKERTSEEVAGIIHLCKPKSKTHFYDLPCGYGRHSVELAQLGYMVTGFDINPVHLKEARQKSRRKSLQFLEHNMINPLPLEHADVCINMFYSFGFFKTDKENELVLKHIYNALKSDGKFLMHTDVNIPMLISGTYKFKESRTLTTGATLYIDEHYDKTSKRIIGSWTIGKKCKRYSVRVYSEKEFIQMCKKVGFKHVTSYSDWNGSPYNKNSELMIILATK